MPTPAPRLLLVPFREVQHDQPEDFLHYEPIALRGEQLGWKIPSHLHEGLHQFQLLEHGSAHGSIDGEPFALRAPAIFMLAPRSVHGFEYRRNSAGHQLTLPGATLQAALAGLADGRDRLNRSFMRGPEALGDTATQGVALFSALAREFSGHAPGRAQALLAWASLVALWFLRQGDTPSTARRGHGARDTLVQRLRALVELHYREHQALGFYATALKVTPDHLSRSCRSVTGRGALDLVRERLLLEARRLLTYTAAPVTKIAHDLGYQDAAYFSKVFFRAAGKSPTRYRESAGMGLRLLDPPGGP